MRAYQVLFAQRQREPPDGTKQFLYSESFYVTLKTAPVLHTEPGGPASKAGSKEGDREKGLQPVFLHLDQSASKNTWDSSDPAPDWNRGAGMAGGTMENTSDGVLTVRRQASTQHFGFWEF